MTNYSIEPKQHVANKVIGKTVEAAKAICEKENARCRIRSVDGNLRILTRDYKLDRVNLTIENGIVVSASVG